MTETPVLPTNLVCAKAYARRGWAVFPIHSPRGGGVCSCGDPSCRSPGKHPRTATGLKEATTDIGKIQTWWDTWPDANIGVVTGRTEGAALLCVDIDPRHGGNDTLNALELTHGILPPHLIARTGGGGSHHIFTIPDGERIRSGSGKLGPGVDVKGEGGYFIAAPSLHVSGSRYEWVNLDPILGNKEYRPEDNLPPTWLLELLGNGRPSAPGAPSTSPSPIPDKITEGVRNDTLFRLAAALRAKGLGKEAIQAALLVENRARCQPPLPEDEVRSIAGSVGRYLPGALPPVEVERGKVEALARIDRVKAIGERIAAGQRKRLEAKVEAGGAAGEVCTPPPAEVDSSADRALAELANVDLVDQVNKEFLRQTEALGRELAARAAGAEPPAVPRPSPFRNGSPDLTEEEYRRELERLDAEGAAREREARLERISKTFISYDGKHWNIDYPAFVQYLTERFHVIGFNREPWIYLNGIFRPGRGELERAIIEMFEAAGMDDAVEGRTRELLFRVMYSNNETEYPFDRRTDLIPVQNGVVQIDYATGERRLLDHSPGFRFTYMLPVMYDGCRDPSVVMDIFEEWTSEEEAPLLFQLPAMALLQAQGAVFKKSYLIIGPKDTGKTCYAVDLLTALFGEPVISRVALQSLMEDRFRTADLEGKILNVRDDLSALTIKEAGKYKELVGSQHHDIYRKGKQGYTGRVFCVHLYTANLIPDLRDTIHNDDAFFEKWEIIQFSRMFSKNETFRTGLLAAEILSAFLNGVLDTMVRIRKDNIVQLSTSEEVRDIWLVGSDPFHLAEFINRNLMRDDRDQKEREQLDKDELTEAYGTYAKRRDLHGGRELKPLIKDSLCKKLEHRGFFSTRPRVGDKRKYVLVGYGWLPTALDRPQPAPSQQTLG